MFTKFSDLVKKSNLLLPNDALQFNAYVMQAWKEAKGIDEELKANLKITMIKGTVLHLSSHNALWAQEAQLQKGQFLKELNKVLKKYISKKISHIEIRVE